MRGKIKVDVGSCGGERGLGDEEGGGGGGGDRHGGGGGGHGGDGGWVRARLREDKVGDSLGSCQMFLAGKLASGLSYWAPVGPRKPSGASRFPVVSSTIYPHA